MNAYVEPFVMIFSGLIAASGADSFIRYYFYTKLKMPANETHSGEAQPDKASTDEIEISPKSVKRLKVLRVIAILSCFIIVPINIIISEFSDDRPNYKENTYETYTNEEYSFEIDYPTRMIVVDKTMQNTVDQSIYDLQFSSDPSEYADDTVTATAFWYNPRESTQTITLVILENDLISQEDIALPEFRTQFQQDVDNELQNVYSNIKVLNDIEVKHLGQNDFLFYSFYGSFLGYDGSGYTYYMYTVLGGREALFMYITQTELTESGIEEFEHMMATFKFVE